MKKVVHFEIPADNIERAKKFYQETFDWQIMEWELPDGSVYVGVRTVEVDESTHLPKETGAINGGIYKREKNINTPVIMISVPSIDEYIEKIKAAGGKLVEPKKEIMGIGYYAYFTDTEGSLFGLWEDVK